MRAEASPEPAVQPDGVGHGGARRPWYRSARFWVSFVTFVVVAALLFGAREQVASAIESLARVNIPILLLLVPVQLASFWVTGETLFSFLRARGELKGMHPLSAVRMSLEFNFANHMLPSGGAAGIAYTSWKLGTLGVPASRATLGQLVRFGVTFVSFSILLLAATIWLLASGQSATLVLWAAGVVGGVALVGVGLGLWLLGRRRPLHRFAGVITRIANGALALVRVQRRLNSIVLVRFFDGIYLELRTVTEQPRTLVKPFLWSFVVNIADASLFVIALAAFGVEPDLALVFVAYGLATLASIVIVTPNGLGAYELAMIMTLVSGGIQEGTAIAAIVLARVVLLLGTVVFGWGFYQHSVAKAGAPRAIHR